MTEALLPHPGAGAATVWVNAEPFDSEAAVRLRAAGRLEHDRATGVRTSGADAHEREVLLNLVARDGAGTAVACAALLPAEEGVVELHRLFIAADARSSAAGAALLLAVEESARQLNAPAVVYETASQLTDAIDLLTRHGYQRIAPWRAHRDAAPVLALAREID
jgi:N-acetylglutamate synthase-like GNAT family acetyltransferase